MKTYDEILTVVKSNMSDTLNDFDASKVAPEKSIRFYGADSLEIVEVVSKCMKELQIKAPRTEMMKATSIDELVKILVEYSNKNA